MPLTEEEKKKNKLWFITNIFNYFENFQDNEILFQEKFIKIFNNEKVINKKIFKKNIYDWKWFFNNFKTLNEDYKKNEDNSNHFKKLENLNYLFKKTVINYIKNNKNEHNIYHKAFSFEDYFKNHLSEGWESLNKYLEKFLEEEIEINEFLAQAIADILQKEITISTDENNNISIKPNNILLEQKINNNKDVNNSMNAICKILIDTSLKEEIEFLIKPKNNTGQTIELKTTNYTREELEKHKKNEKQYTIIELKEINDFSKDIEEKIIQNIFKNSKSMEALQSGKTVILFVPLKNTKIDDEKLENLLKSYLHENFEVHNLSKTNNCKIKESNENLLEENNIIKKSELNTNKTTNNEHLNEPLMEDEVLNVYS